MREFRKMNNTLFVVRDTETAEMNAAQPAKFPVGELIAMQRSAQDQNSEDSQASIGIWESSPGKFKRFLPNREFSHILQGWCIFTPEGGEPVELRAGDAVLFPANCQGEWDIKEDFRKTYCLF